MSVAIAERTYTPEDLLTGDWKGYELVNGHLVENEMGAVSSWVAGRIIRLLGASAEDRGLGWVLPSDTGYQCFQDDRQKVRKPDVSFIGRGRLPGDRLPDGHIQIPPDLAVEVASPNDLVYELDVKVAEYLAAGVPTVWVVYPETHAVQVIHSDGTSARLNEADQLTIPELDPDFRCKVGDFFSLPTREDRS